MQLDPLFSIDLFPIALRIRSVRHTHIELSLTLSLARLSRAALTLVRILETQVSGRF